jgi:ABC-type transport system substrate-binding protein
MIRSVSRALLFVLPLAVFVGACGSPTTPTTTTTATTTTTTTTTPTTVSTTETYNGVLVSGASNLHTFHTMPGVVTVTLVSLDPSTLYPPVGLGLGMWDGTTCALVLQSTLAEPATALVGTASVETDLCVKVWDPTPFASDYILKYQVTAVHYVKSSS